MTTTAPRDLVPRHGRAPRRSGGSAVYSAIGVLGELLITLGFLVLAFLVWQLWWTDVEGNQAQAEIVESLPWAPPAAAAAASGEATPVVAAPRRDEPPVIAEPGHAVTFATVQVPRWSDEPERPISQGVDRPTVLDVLGIGHYPETAMPGAIGNFSLAGHRTTYGKPLNRIAELQDGDPIVVRTADTWYVYRVTSSAIVTPQDVQVIDPVPGQPGVEPTERMITLTTCHPMFSARERYVVHGVLDYWAPVADGSPAEILGGA
ncbi:class E sortase [Cellulomonas chengniuliangii]|uniref:Class E sortase n=1 Tax=Cellulomonas chengniuliangii TaxID=2968084 RepID=A0ABY5KYY3_9CELL|nr:class E sortase [Cellulomonas chengniuliangii]MCC2307874.1 class E sortase [Cellulomonas chengniuliangii]UUI75374.1 class E sortase [Cellulomonas chengniuliangii]